MLNKCLLWSLSREGRSVKEGRRGVQKCGHRDRKGSERRRGRNHGRERERRSRSRSQRGGGHATSPAPQAQPAVLAWPRLLPNVVIKTTHAFLLLAAAPSAKRGPGYQGQQLSPDVPSCKMRTQRCHEGHRSLGGVAKRAVLSGGNHTTEITRPGPQSLPR